MPAVTFALPGDPETLTGGYIYDARILTGLAELGWSTRLLRLGDGFPCPSEATRVQAGKLLAGCPDGSLVVVDGLAGGVLPEALAAQSKRLRLIALVHHPLAEETGLEDVERQALFESERRALSQVQGVIVTSPATARNLQAYDVPRERILIVPPGTDPAPLAQGSGGPDVALLCVASLTPRKGHALLFQALAQLRDLPWRLLCLGSHDLSPATAQSLLDLCRALHLEDRIALAPEVPPAELSRHYQTADLFVLPSYHEGYGMALAEALAHGLPIVSTQAGAIPDTVPSAAGRLVPPGDLAALTEALRELLTDEPLRRRLAAGAQTAREDLPDWSEAALSFEIVLLELGGD